MSRYFIKILVSSIAVLSVVAFTASPIYASPLSARCEITSLEALPSSPQTTGTSITIKVKANCEGGVRAIRLKADGNIFYELGSPEYTTTWNTSGVSGGTHRITAEAAGRDDNNWTSAASRSIDFTINSNSQQSQQQPPQQQNQTSSSPTCSITSLSSNSSSVQIGNSVSVYGSANCSPSVRAIRFKVDGNILYEIGAPSGGTTWNTSGTWTGNHSITIEAAGVGDNNWTYAARSTIYINVWQEQSQQQHQQQVQQQQNQQQTQQNQQQQNTNSPNIQFWVDRSNLQGGECTSVKWYVTGVNAVFLSYNGNREPRAGHINNEQRVCPSSTTTYILEIDTGRGWETRRDTITVNGSSTSNSEGGAGNSNSTSGSNTPSYTVVAGDTLWGIAQKFGTDVDTIMQLNKWLTDPNTLYAGWVLQVPVNTNSHNNYTPRRVISKYAAIWVNLKLKDSYGVFIVPVNGKVIDLLYDNYYSLIDQGIGNCLEAVVGPGYINDSTKSAYVPEGKMGLGLCGSSRQVLFLRGWGNDLSDQSKWILVYETNN